MKVKGSEGGGNLFVLSNVPFLLFLVILWDIPHVTQLRSLLAQIKSEEQRIFIRDWLDNFEANVLPLLPSLRSQVHNL